MKNTLFYFYITGGLIELCFLVYIIVKNYPAFDLYAVIGNGAFAIMFFTVAYRWYRDKKKPQIITGQQV